MGFLFSKKVHVTDKICCRNRSNIPATKPVQQTPVSRLYAPPHRFKRADASFSFQNPRIFSLKELERESRELVVFWDFRGTEPLISGKNERDLLSFMGIGNEGGFDPIASPFTIPDPH
ncbi:MAG: hypothetical protein EB051_02935 [Chlamydiia bacterium]|nr:hypothetical protein [Chlamydiia bacterium]